MQLNDFIKKGMVCKSSPFSLFNLLIKLEIRGGHLPTKVKETAE